VARLGTRISRAAVGTSVVVLVIGIVLATGMPVAASPEHAAGTLQLAGAILGGPFSGVACPPGEPAGSDCFSIANSGAVRGLGTVSESGTLVIEAPDTACEVFQSTPVLTVAGKGTIELSVRTPTGACVDGSCGCGNVNVTQQLTVSGGTGAYAAASGSGTVTTQGTVLRQRLDTLAATLVAPDASFDLTPPVISGMSAKTVRAPKRKHGVQVRYAAGARDDVDGPVPVSCKPASGSVFRIGRTQVTCTAEDSSANTATGRFTITVKR
jgi:hypothetical protein